MKKKCKHNWKFLREQESEKQLSFPLNMRFRVMENVFFCSKCLKQRVTE